MQNNVFVKNYPPPAVDEKEILRYAGYRGDVDERTLALLRTCVEEYGSRFSYRVCFTAVRKAELLGKLSGGSLLQRKLCGAEYGLVFAATVGLDADRIVLQESARSPARALFLQAFGTERIESLCDLFCKDIEKACQRQGYFTGTRFSAGYGDFPIERQKDIFAILDCTRKIGLTLNDSLLMSPTKSVTAIIPIGKAEEESLDGCAVCAKEDCPYKKG